MLRNLVLQSIVFIMIFNGISWLKESDMLSTDTQVAVTHQLSTLSQEVVTLGTTGKKTLVYFFAPWCSVCHISIENVQDFYLSNPNIDVIAVALDYVDIDEVTDFTRQHQLTFPVGLGTEAVKKAFKIKGYPSYYVLDEQNTVIAKSMGYSSEIGLYLRSL